MSGRAGAPSGRFPSRARVRKRVEFLKIQDNGLRVSTPRFVLILSSSPASVSSAPASGASTALAPSVPPAAGLNTPLSAASSSPRLGITASRRVGNAVVRSRAKRLVREAFRATRELWPAGIDLVVIVKRSTGESKLDSVIAEFRAAKPQIEKRVRTLLGPVPAQPSKQPSSAS
ncbi:MAG TPA: ribonuclease P protein component [Polyangiaceae bacterium]|nr:ribonuclease P protein component [Polyangiaceae bacterium]